MSKTLKEKWKSHVGNLVEVKIQNGIFKTGLLLDVALPDRKIYWYETDKFKLGASAYDCLWKTAPSKQRRMLALTIFSIDAIEVFVVLKEDIKIMM